MAITAKKKNQNLSKYCMMTVTKETGIHCYSYVFNKNKAERFHKEIIFISCWIPYVDPNF